MRVTLSIKSGRGVFALARERFGTPSTPGRWLVALRWLALGGMALTTHFGGGLVPHLDTRPVWVVLVVLALANVAWTVVVRLVGDGLRTTVAPQILADVVALSSVLWFSGGVGNPFASFLSFQIVLAGLLGSRRTMLQVTALAVACACLLAWAPPLNLEGARLGELAVSRLADVVSLVALGGFTGFFVSAYAKRLEEMQDAAARAEKLAALGRTMGSIAHELNTPLGTMLLAGKEVGLAAAEAGLPELARLGETIAEEAQRAGDVIALLRGYVRPDAKREDVDVSTFVATYAQRELDRLKFDGERHIRVCQPVEAPVLRAALCQVLTNVLANAVDALASTPHRRVEVEVAALERSVEVTVRDNGPGVPDALLARLGEPFQTTKGDQGGTGLGLYVSSLLAERMGATLQLESVPSQGTRVTLSLPRAGAPTA